MLKKIQVMKQQICLVVLLLGFIWAGGIHVHAAQEMQPTGEEYPTQYEDAIKLADMLRKSPYLVHNKLYTAQQEVELQALVDTVCDGKESDREKAVALLTCIKEKMEPGECFELNGWDTLCDGDTEMTIKGISEEEISVPKKQADQQTYCFTFYDICRLANIPCFIIEDCAGDYEVDNEYICMVYIENASATGKEWHFVDVMAEDRQLIAGEDVYEFMGNRIFPMNILLDYDRMMNVMNVIYLNKETMLSYSAKNKITPHLAYERDTDMVKTYFRDGTLANGEQYCRSETYVAENGEAPSGWIETKMYANGEVTTCLQYSLYGVFLRGRIAKDDTEYNLTGDFYDAIPYHAEAGCEQESAEHKAYISEYKQKLEDKAIAVAEALLEDENYIWNDTNFNAEEEARIREAVETALDWEYITSHEISVNSFENAGISLDSENPEDLSDKAKAQAILAYIKRNVEPVRSAPWNVTSAIVLESGVGTCAGFTLLYRDMCVMAGLPCFQLGCSVYMNISDSLFVDHGNNLVKAGDEWIFVDPIGSYILGMGTGYQAAIFEGYATMDKRVNFLDCETMRKDNYYKWNGGNNVLDYYDFDSQGNLGIYRRNRFGEPVVIDNGINKTDENGKYLLENGLHIIDLTETSEDGMAQVVMRYAYYYQNGWLLKGDKVINGEEYHFNMDDINHYRYHKVGELSRKYYINKLEFKEIEDQPYNKNGVYPIPEIYHGDKKLELGKDFKIVEYMHNKEVTSYTDASYKVEGIGDYIEEATRYFKIVQADISNADVTLSETSFKWTPGEYYYRPEVEVDSDLGLDWQDYTVAYYDYDKIGKASVVITGKGNYKGSITKYYDITAREFNENEFKILDRYGEELQSQEFSYNFYSVKPEAKLYWYDEDGMKYSLLEGDEYDISYSGADKPGIVTVTVTAKGNYRGSLTCTYKIKEYDIGDNSGVSQFLFKEFFERYTGSPIIPEIPDFGNLEEGVHYTMTVTNNVNVGMAKIILQGIGVCTGTYEKEFEIAPYILWENTINPEYTYTTYNGNVQKPLVTINAALVEGRDYFISYAKKVDGEYRETAPKEVGEYWIVIRVTDNVWIRQSSGSEIDAPKCYYIRYSINSDGTGNSGFGTGNSNTGSEVGNGNVTTGNTVTGSGNKDNNSQKENANSVPNTNKNNGSDKKPSNNTTYNKIYNIKTIKTISMKKAIKLNWTKVKKAKGYQIQISLNKKFKKAKIINVKKTKKSYTLKRLKAKKKYYIRIRAYGKKGNKNVYGKWKTSSQKTK